jgi:hypothetical protein
MLFLSTPSRYAVGGELQFHSFITLILNSIEWTASIPGQFTLMERIADWVLSRPSLEVWEKNKIFVPARIRTPDCPAHSLIHI